MEATAPGDVCILREVDGHIAVLTMHDPATRNALTERMLADLGAALDHCEQDQHVRAVILTGGRRYFASGADIRQLRDTSPADYLSSRRAAVWDRINRFTKPTLAAVAGFALGGGCELALSCDIVVAADTAVFGQPELSLGLIPAAGGTQRWARASGRYMAARVVLAGESVDAWRALDLNLVAEVVPAAALLPAARELAERIARSAPVAARLARGAVRATEEVSLSAGLAQERSALATVLSTSDLREGIDAFLEKRPPSFSGR